VVLPGFDPGLAAEVWDDIGPEHPWSAFRRLLDRLGARPGDVRAWVEPDPASAPRRRLVAEALRPAPATDGWMGARAGLAAEAAAATAGLSLIEAPDPRREAAAIALALREAVAEGRTAALVTPDRTLARRVAAALARWGIEPDDSGGRPLGLTPPGVFLRLIADVACGPFDPASLLGLLKHPLMAAGPGRAAHLAAARRFELRVLRRFPALPDLAACRAALAARAAAEAAGLSLIDDGEDDASAPPPPDRADADAIDAVLARLAALADGAGRSLADRAAAHVAAAEDFAGAALWAQAAGEAARAATDGLLAAADAYGPCPAAVYPALFAAALAGAEAREEAFRPDPRVMIWGPLEARMQGADLLVLGGLAEGVWPAVPDPGPWLGREMRARAGLPALETRLGLAAHDVLQAACAPRAVLTRSLRSGEAPTTPSRWLARLTTLLEGVAPAALAAMRARGARFAALAAALERAEAERAAAPPARRPHPRPPAAARPVELWATQIQTLIRDPYAVYARHVLGLRPLDPVGRGLDARDRGVALHEALARFVRATEGWDPDRPSRDWAAALAEAGEAAWAVRAAPTALRRLWRARLERLAPAFLAEEVVRRRLGRPLVELEGERRLDAPAFALRARADRIDLRDGGGVAIYDYKSGRAPSPKQIASFDKQMPLEAAIALGGVWRAGGGAQARDFSATGVEALAYIPLGGPAGGRVAPLEGEPAALAARAWEGLGRLIGSYAEARRPYPSRSRPMMLKDEQPYDHLARHGEWEDGEDDTQGPPGAPP
jgi:double-strand break repair protein AddB